MAAHDFEDRTDDVKIKENYSFDSMLLPNHILEGLKRNGFKRPSPIQFSAIPLVRCGLDLIIEGKSGTGKTLVFTIGILESISLLIKRPQVVVLAPTREIALQISDVISTVGKHLNNLKVGTFIGGIAMDTDRKTIPNCQVVVGTPGRVRHLIEEKIMDISAVRMFVLDEADKILENTYQKEVNYIFNNLDQAKQILACSATYTPELLEFVNKYMKKGTHVTPSGANPVLLGLRQFVFLTPDHVNTYSRQKYKQTTMFRILSTLKFDQCLIFYNYITRADSAAQILKAQGYGVVCLTSKQNQFDRIDAMEQIKKHKARILVTTDLAARGIDASCVNLIINMDCPTNPATYLHRMGRAGRFGAQGVVISIISKGDDEYDFRRMLGQIVGGQFTVNIIPSEKRFSEVWKVEEGFWKKITPLIEENEDKIEKEKEEIKEENYSNEAAAEDEVEKEEGRKEVEYIKEEVSKEVEYIKEEAGKEVECIKEVDLVEDKVQIESDKEIIIQLIDESESDLETDKDSDSMSNYNSPYGEWVPIDHTLSSNSLDLEENSTFKSPYGEWMPVVEEPPVKNHELPMESVRFNQTPNVYSEQYCFEQLQHFLSETSLSPYEQSYRRTDWYSILNNQIQKYTEYARQYRSLNT